MEFTSTIINKGWNSWLGGADGNLVQEGHSLNDIIFIEYCV